MHFMTARNDRGTGARKHLTIRHVSPRLARLLEAERRRTGASLNQTVLDLLHRALGVTEEPHDNGLGALAGTWTEEDLAEFDRATADFSRLDEDMWRP